MSSKLRRLLSAVLRPVKAAGAALRARSAVAWALMLCGMLVLVVAVAALTSNPNGQMSGPRQHPGVPAKRTTVDTFSYSNLRDAIKARTVKTRDVEARGVQG